MSDNLVDGKNKGFIQIPSALMHEFLHLNNAQSQNIGIDAFLLYSFYIYTSIWQNEKYNINNRPKATRSYCKKGLHWSTNRFTQAKKLLIDMGLIKERKVRFKGKFTGNYVELSYVNNNKPPVLQNHSAVEWSPNTDGMSILNTEGKDNMTFPVSLPSTVYVDCDYDSKNGSRERYREFKLNRDYTLNDFQSLYAYNPALLTHVSRITGVSEEEVDNKAHSLWNSCSPGTGENGFERATNPVGLLIEKVREEYGSA